MNATQFHRAGVAGYTRAQITWALALTNEELRALPWTTRMDAEGIYRAIWGA